MKKNNVDNLQHNWCTNRTVIVIPKLDVEIIPMCTMAKEM